MLKIIAVAAIALQLTVSVKAGEMNVSFDGTGSGLSAVIQRVQETEIPEIQKFRSNSLIWPKRYCRTGKLCFLLMLWLQTNLTQMRTQKLLMQAIFLTAGWGSI